MRFPLLSIPAMVLVIMAVCAAPLASQELPVATAPYVAFEAGDGMLFLTLGAKLPLGFINPNSGEYQKANMFPGFAFGLSYLHFLNGEWALGGELAGAFINTIAERRLFMAPLAVRITRIFNIEPFIIVPSVGLGVAVTALGEDKHLDALFKLGSSFLWRVNPDMSYGLNIMADIVPQLYKDSSQNRTGFFMDATLSVVYHL
jgi:hypothetical protein